MAETEKEGKRGAKSFSKRIIKVWIFGIVVPLLIVESLILWQFYRINHHTVDEEIENSLTKTAGHFKDLMNSMNSISWLLEADKTVGKDLHLYFDEDNTIKKGDLLIYLQGQIANYEVANPSIGNLAYLYLPKEGKRPVKINQSSLANGDLPDEKYYLCKWKDITFYGPLPSKSKAASYPCLSLLRSYKIKQAHGDVYIYLESGYKYFQKLLPAGIMGMDTVFLIESENGRTMYSSDESLVPLFSRTANYLKQMTETSHRFRDYDKIVKGNWKLHLWISAADYYRQIYGMALNFSIVTILAVLVCILVSILQWRSIYRPFTHFEKRLRRIASDQDVEIKVEQMNIQEFDDSFVLLEKMKKHILLLLNRVQDEEKKRSELELRVVLGKINPHFLYNTLDTLKWYAAGKSDKQMVHFITALNKLLLYNMSKNRETTLRSELDAVDAYIVLQRLKYEKIEFVMNTGRYPEILQADMPRFILQPLVENAILHSGCCDGKIWIEVELLANGKIAILIKNEGVPIDPDKIRTVLIQKNDISSNGIGLQYVARMLENRFAGEFQLKAERTEDGINVVEIRIPFGVKKGKKGSKTYGEDC